MIEKTPNSKFQIAGVAAKWFLTMGTLWWVYAGLLVSLRAVLGHLRWQFANIISCFTTYTEPLFSNVCKILDLGNMLLVGGALVCLGLVLLFSLAEIRWGRKHATTVLGIGLAVLLGTYSWALFAILFPFVDVPDFYPQ